MNPKPLLALNHFTVPCSLLTALLFSGPLVRPHFFKLSDAPSPEPLNRAAAVFKLHPEDRKAVNRARKIGRKCDLATALLPKGDTRATNAKPEYYKLVFSATDFF